MNEAVYKIHSFIDFQSGKFFEQNDLIVLNVYEYKNIELLVYMFQEVINDINIHTSPDLNYVIIRVLKGFTASKLKPGTIGTKRNEQQ